MKMRTALIFAVAIGVAILGYASTTAPALFWSAVLVLAVVAWFQPDASNLVCYAALLGIQTWIPGEDVSLSIRFAVADLFMLPIAVRWGWAHLRSGQATPTTMRWVVTALAAVMGVATIIGIARLGRLTPYVWANKDLGILFLIGGLLALTSALRTRRDIERLVAAFVIGVSVANVLALVATAAAVSGIANFSFRVSSGRLYGWMANPSAYGSLLATVALIELARIGGAAAGSRRARAIRIANYALLLCSILLTFSRSTWLALAVGAGTVAALQMAFLSDARGKSWRLAGALATALVALAPIGWVAFDQRLRLERIARAADGTSPEQVEARVADACVARWDPPVCASLPAAAVDAARRRGAARDPEYAEGAMTNVRGLTDRLSILRAAWSQYVSSPATIAFGIGLGTFYATSAAVFGVPLIVHNTAAWFLVEMGLPGIAVFLWLLGRAAVNLWSCRAAVLGVRELALGVAAAGTAWLAFSMFNEAFYARHFWLLLVCADCLARLDSAEPAAVAIAPPLAARHQMS